MKRKILDRNTLYLMVLLVEIVDPESRIKTETPDDPANIEVTEDVESFSEDEIRSHIERRSTMVG